MHIKEYILHIGCYIAVFILAVFYSYVLYLGRTPSCSAEYTAFFIDHTVDAWPGENGFDYEMNTPLLLNTSAKDITVIRKRGCGWSTVESDGTWTNGTKAFLYMRMINRVPKKEVYLNLQLAAIIDGVSVRVNINRYNIGEITGHAREYRFRIPYSIVEDGVAKIVFDVKNPIRPAEAYTGSTDTRLLGLRMTSLQLSQ